ncbi:MAG: HAD-IA family hydrolase [Dehalococcoidia bacterium]
MTTGASPVSLIDEFEGIDKAWERVNRRHRNVAIMFVDMAQSTDYKVERGMDLGVKKVVTFNRRVAEVFEARAASFVRKRSLTAFGLCKYLGDGVLAYVEGPSAAKDAVQIGADIQRHLHQVNEGIVSQIDKYKAKIGIDYGSVLFAEYFTGVPADPHGSVVDRGARLVGLAKPGQILVSANVKRQFTPKNGLSFGTPQARRLKGFRDSVKVHEVVWDKRVGQMHVQPEEPPAVHMIAAEDPDVLRFIEDNGLFEKSSKLDLWLYTYETLDSGLRSRLEESPTPKGIRLLIRNPGRDQRKRAKVIGSLAGIAEVTRANPKVNFAVRFYEEEPLPRVLIFHLVGESPRALIGMYKYDPSHPMELVGAERNFLIYAKDESIFERHLLEVYQGRFDFAWRKLTTQKAVLFDLDGVVIDSMDFYRRAWVTAFRKTAGIDIDPVEIYKREGEQKDETARALYRMHRDGDPDQETIRRITDAKEREYRRLFDLQIMPGIEDLIKSLKSKGVRLGLVTGSTSLETKFAKRPDFLKLFDVQITADDTKNGKPHRQPYAKAVERLGVAAEDCCVVENAPYGIESARGAGLLCFALRGNSLLPDSALHGADFICSDVSELAGYLTWADSNLDLRTILNMLVGKEDPEGLGEIDQSTRQPKEAVVKAEPVTESQARRQ